MGTGQIVLRILTLSLFLFNTLPAYATQQVVQYFTHAPVSVCTPSDTNTNCGGTGGGGVGIGTVNSGSQYQIPYYSPSGSSHTISGATNFYDVNNTNVGIGTALPQAMFDAYGSTRLTVHTWYVPCSGNGGSIQNYINAAAAGDTLILSPCTYFLTTGTGGLTINKQLTLEGSYDGTEINVNNDNLTAFTLNGNGDNTLFKHFFLFTLNAGDTAFSIDGSSSTSPSTSIFTNVDLDNVHIAGTFYNYVVAKDAFGWMKNPIWETEGGTVNTGSSPMYGLETINTNTTTPYNGGWVIENLDCNIANTSSTAGGITSCFHAVDTGSTQALNVDFSQGAKVIAANPNLTSYGIDTNGSNGETTATIHGGHFSGGTDDLSASAGSITVYDSILGHNTMTGSVFTGAGVSQFGNAITVAGGGITNSGNFQNGNLLVTTGNIGIGTATPGQKLDVNGTVRLKGFIDTTNPTSGFVMTTNSVGVGTWAAAPSGSGSGTVTSVTFTGDGTVLSATPTSAITTSGTLTATLATQTANTVLGATGTTLTALPVNSCSGATNALIWTTGTGFGCNTISGSGSNYWSLNGGAGNVGISTTNTVGIGTTSGNGAGLVVMNGNVGIGTWNPTNAEDVKGNMVIGTYAGIVADAAPTNGLNVSGNVNIGTFTSARTLTVLGSGSAVGMALVNKGTGGQEWDNLSISNTSSFPAGSWILFNSSTGASALTVTSNGNVGIAQSTSSVPINRLEVSNNGGTGNLAVGFAAGAISAPTNGIIAQGNVGIGTNLVLNGLDVAKNVSIGTAYAGYYTAPTNGLLVQGNVGIGSVNPVQMLDISGTARMTGFSMATGATNTYVLTSDANGNGTWTAATGGTSTNWTNVNTTDVDLPSGNVGIGTTFTTTSALTVMNGNVGIGTWKPIAAFTVGNAASATAAGGINLGFAGANIYRAFASNSSLETDSAGLIFSNTATIQDNAALTLQGAGSATAGNGLTLNVHAAFTPTSGDAIGVTVNPGFSPASGSATYESIKINPIINQTGTGITRGLFVNPTLTAATDFRAIETSIGNVGIGTISGNLGIGSQAPGQRLDVQGTVRLSLLGGTLAIASGTNGCQGQALLSSGTVTVSTTCTPSTSQGIFLQDATTGSLVNVGTPTVGTVTGGTSFVINSSNALDSSNVNWWILKSS